MTRGRTLALAAAIATALSRGPILWAQEATEAEEQTGPGFSASGTVSLRYALPYQGLPLGWLDALRGAEPLVEATLGYETATGLGASMTLRLILEYGTSQPYSLPIGFSGNPVLVENNLLYGGELYAPLLGGLLRLGRIDVSLGPSRLSNLQITQAVPYLDAVAYDLPLGPVRITQIVATLENRQGIDDRDPPFDSGGYHYYNEGPYTFGENVILLSSRRFSVKAGALELGLGAQSIASRPYNAFQLGDVLPIFSVHNCNVGFHNFSLYLDGALEAAEGHTQYAIVGLDDFNSSSVGIADTGLPTIWAFVVGARGRFTFSRDIALSYDIEGTATHYLWGSFYESYYLSRSIYRLVSDAGIITLPLTSPFGPARASAELRTELSLPYGLSLMLDGLLLYGDPSISLATTAYQEGSAGYTFLLGRIEARLAWALPLGLSAYAGGGLDATPAGVVPRLCIGGRWRFGD